MQFSQIAVRYADALFRLSKEKKENLDSVLKNLREVAGLYSENSEMQFVFTNPTIKREQKKSLVEKMLKEEKSSIIADFCRLLSEKDRFSLIRDIADEFQALVNQEKNVKKVMVYSSTDLDDSQKKSIKKSFSGYLGQDVDVENVIDETLIGGIVVKIGDEIIDGSINCQLDRMKEIFSKE